MDHNSKQDANPNDKHCKTCGVVTDHDPSQKLYNGCTVCMGAKITVNEICEKMSVCRQAVYTKAVRKGINKRYFQPPVGKKYLVYTEGESLLLTEQDNRYRVSDKAERSALSERNKLAPDEETV